MSGLLLLRKITVPKVLRLALPALGNIWQSALTETSLLSVTGLTELLRMAGTAAGSTRQPLLFYATAALMFVIIGRLMVGMLSRLELRANSRPLNRKRRRLAMQVQWNGLCP